MKLSVSLCCLFSTFLSSAYGMSATPQVQMPVETPPSAEIVSASTDNIVKEELKLSTYSAVLAGMVLCFNSGYINGCCLKGTIANTAQASAAVTGAWTISAISAAAGEGIKLRRQGSMILSYIFGSFLAGLANPKPIPFQVSSRVGPTFLLSSALLFTAIFKTNDSFMLFYLCAVVCGIQNSVTSVHSSNLVRSAHMSGMSSDMGTFLGQVVGGNKANLPKLKTFVALASCFWIGGLFSWFVTEQYAGSSSLMLSAVLTGAIGLTLTTM